MYFYADIVRLRASEVSPIEKIKIFDIESVGYPSLFNSRPSHLASTLSTCHVLNVHGGLLNEDAQ